MSPQQSSQERTLAILKASPARRFSTKELSALVHCQDNTLIKVLKFIRDEGEPVFRHQCTAQNRDYYSEWSYKMPVKKRKVCGVCGVCGADWEMYGSIKKSGCIACREGK